MTRRIRLLASYDGTDFSGFARQDPLRTIRGCLEEAVSRLNGSSVSVWGASRTDAGAHARGQVCHFDTVNPMPGERWARVLNDLLPQDLRILGSSVAAPTFDSRFSALDRHYRYRILVGGPDPFRSRYAHAYGRPLDTARMVAASRALVGRHDFRAYTEELDPTVENTVRILTRVAVRQVRDEVWLDVIGTAFLRGMMRRMAGALFEVGRGYRQSEDIAILLTGGTGVPNLPVVLPAQGLCLMRVRYGRHPRDHRDVPTE